MKVILLERIWINGTTKIVSRSYHAVVGMDSSTGSYRKFTLNCHLVSSRQQPIERLTDSM